jgi:hypothetical protein
MYVLFMFQELGFWRLSGASWEAKFVYVAFPVSKKESEVGEQRY